MRNAEQKQLKQLTPVIILLIAVLLFSQIVPFTPLANDKFGYTHSGMNTMAQQRTITLSFTDEFYIETYPSQVFIPQKMQRAFTISIDLNSLDELKQIVSQGFGVVNFTLKVLSYTAVADMGGYGVTGQYAEVTSYINAQEIHKTILKTSTTEPVYLQFSSEKYIFQGNIMNLTFFLKTSITGLSAGANLKVKSISTTILVTLDQINNIGNYNPPENYTYSKPVPPPIRNRFFIVSWLDLVFVAMIDPEILVMIAILLGVIVCINLLTKRQRKTRH